MDTNPLPDPPEPPSWLSAEAAYGWGCGWLKGYEAAIHDYGFGDCTCGFGGFHEELNMNCEMNKGDSNENNLDQIT